MAEIISFPGQRPEPPAGPLSATAIIEREIQRLQGLADLINGSTSNAELSGMYSVSAHSLGLWLDQIRVEFDPRMQPVLLMSAYHDAVAMVAIAAEQTPGAA